MTAMTTAIVNVELIAGGYFDPDTFTFGTLYFNFHDTTSR